MSTIRVSVVVLNRDRIRSLGRTLKALTHQTWRAFDLVLVSNQCSKVRRAFPEASRIQMVPCAAAGVSRARNLGINAAGGEIIAFCDDDAVPEPTWLERLVVPFNDEKVGAVGGLVRGRNGVSIQWGFQEVDQMGNDWPCAAGSPLTKARTPKTVGTNCAFRREALREIGGFDEAFRFFLDETDVNWRLTAGGWKTVLVAGAEVHHSYSASEVRTSERVPLSLFEIGASKVLFCRKHSIEGELIDALDGFRDGQRHRLIRAMQLGLLPPERVRLLMASLEAGFIDGAARLSQTVPIGPPSGGTIPFVTGPAPSRRWMSCSVLDRLSARQIAADDAKAGACVTLVDLERTARPLTVRFTDDGYWYHRGGIYGQTERRGLMFRYSTRKGRVTEEYARVGGQRGLFDPVN